MKMKNLLDKIKHRKQKKELDEETIEIEVISETIKLSPTPYVVSETWMEYEDGFKDHAKDFHSRAGSDRFNHDALDLEIETKYRSELQFLKYQQLNHLKSLSNIKNAVLRELITANEHLQEAEARREELENILEEMQRLLDSINERKVGKKS